jgi:dTDP-4-amino-4,6-dideoxygalactose transaminase
MIRLVDLNAQYQSIKTEIDEAIAEVLSDAAFIGGKYATIFEEEFAAYLGVKCCIGCGNGTDALEILLKALGIGRGDEVIVPAHTWISTAESVTTAGATPVFVDTTPALYTINAALIERHITNRTKAIIPVHLYGHPAEMDTIMAIAKIHGLKVIEDCAQAHGATYKGRKVGTIGHAAAFSFFPSKNLGAYGDAGGMVTNDESVAQLARMIANHGRLGKHDHAMEGRNSRLDGLNAAILSVKLHHLEAWTEARRSLAATYDEALEREGIAVPVSLPDCRHVFHLYVVEVTGRDAFREALAANGVETGVHYPKALPFLKAYERFAHRKDDFPVAFESTSRILSLPMYPELQPDTARRIARLLGSLVYAPR